MEPRPLEELVSELWRQGQRQRTKEVRMPPVTRRQEPPRAPSPTAPVNFPAGSLLSAAVPASSLREQRVKVCLYGRNRSGKTTLAAQFPKPMLLVSSEPAHCGGVQSISNVPGIHVILVEPSRERSQGWGRERIEGIGKELASIDHFNTVVVKTATSLQDLILEEMKVEFPGIPLSGRGSKDTFQLRASRLHDTLRPYLDLKHMHVVILAQEKDHNPPTNEGFPDMKAKLLGTQQSGSFIAPSLGSNNTVWLQDACGYVIQILENEVVQEVMVPQTDADGKPLPPAITLVGTGKRQRHLRLLYHPNFAAGGKWNYSPDMPEFVTAETPAALYAAMAAFIPALRG